MSIILQWCIMYEKISVEAQTNDSIPLGSRGGYSMLYNKKEVARTLH